MDIIQRPQDQSKALETKNAEIETLNQRISTLSLLEKNSPTNQTRQPRGESSGTQMVKSYPMEVRLQLPLTTIRQGQ